MGQELIGRHMSMDDDGGRMYDVDDAHFLHLMREDWYAWMYGASLWKARSAEDPKLAKLHALCELLDHFITLCCRYQHTLL